MRLRPDRENGVPVGTQLVWQLRAAIERGELAPGDRLPSLRAAAGAAGVNVATVRAAYARLEADGAVVTEQGRGSFVARRAGADAERRRLLRDEIARLETELVTLPLLPAAAGERTARVSAARLLSADELERLRDVLVDRVDELHAARDAIVERLRDAERRHPPTEAEGRRAPARRSTSSLAGARVRWT